jgi:hypothetical protein
MLIIFLTNYMHDFLVIVFFVMKKSIAVLYLISPTVAYIPVKS